MFLYDASIVSSLFLFPKPPPPLPIRIYHAFVHTSKYSQRISTESIGRNGDEATRQAATRQAAWQLYDEYKRGKRVEGEKGGGKSESEHE